MKFRLWILFLLEIGSVSASTEATVDAASREPSTLEPTVPIPNATFSSLSTSVTTSAPTPAITLIQRLINVTTPSTTTKKAKWYGFGTIPTGKVCQRGSRADESCKDYPRVACVTNSLRVSTCRCKYTHTWSAVHERCMLNVFSICQTHLIRDICAENADCVNDTLALNDDKFCRCRKGFVPILNDENIPSACVPDPNGVPTDLDFPLDYETDPIPSTQAPLQRRFSIITLLILFPQL